MNTVTESLRMAIDSIWHNLVRAGLTMLGIVIGVGAVIGLISLGRGVEAYVNDQFTELGANLIMIVASEPSDDTIERTEPLTTRDLEALNNPQIVPDVMRTGAIYTMNGAIVAQGSGVRGSIRGATANLSEILNWDLAQGRFITEDEVERTARVVVLGYDLVEDLWDDPNFNPIGEVILVNEISLTVIGVFEERDNAFSGDNTAVFVPLSTAQTRLADAHVRGGHEVTTLYAQAQSDEVAYDAEREIYLYLWQDRGITSPEQEDFTISNQAEMLDAVGAITNVLTIFLSIIASISLLVGGIGIMNIMLVTVTERTQEIGLRKAVGARPVDIMTQFLFESVLLSLFGGILGIVVGWLIAIIGTVSVEELTLSVDPDAIILATVVSSLIGIGFGLFPASRAAMMNPIDALRIE